VVPQIRLQHAIAGWKAAKTAEDRDFKHALCVLILLKGQLRGISETAQECGAATSQAPAPSRSKVVTIPLAQRM
jgi:hypothetical protein